MVSSDAPEKKMLPTIPAFMIYSVLLGKSKNTISNPGWVPGQIRTKFGISAQTGLRK